MKAQIDPKIEYMKRMKNLWDEIDPELTFFSAKNLRDQVSRVEENEVVMKTEYRIDKNQNNNVNYHSTAKNSNAKSEYLTTNNTLIVSDTEI